MSGASPRTGSEIAADEDGLQCGYGCNQEIKDQCESVVTQEKMNISPLSKNALKKLKSRERWLEHRKRKRVEEKQRKKERRIALKEAGQGKQLRRFRGKTMEQSACKVRVAIDMSFDDMMSEKDCRRTVQQLNWSYSANRRSPEPLQFYITSFTGKCRKIYDRIESNRNQDIFLKTEPLDDLFEAEEVVYLTADSENILSNVEDSKIYVIGGLVDHNSHKGLCLDLAVRRGYGHARLPIDEFVEMKTRKVLTINHVFEILVHYTNNNDWEKAFFAVIPLRKGMAKKEMDQNVMEEKSEQEEMEKDLNEPEVKRRETDESVTA
ncbi:tRNA (guanine-N(1)-)-methyltransferase [Necator americanus]|uniref:tRNA (guanine(9)-N(1))-methyltransferase n=1 Tax=Necator americanus TaxID=51031 RepID=W2SFM8_NECAM|nr:tRNA (guanine-N(1)-)-methyltransferase [Necator americanus]ETN68419.1 tRNA (guanine-N(1)-)-methyltransferase [Necator americanus]